METEWLSDDERGAWVRLAAVLELLPGVLDTQLRRDADLTHFEYFLLAMLSEAPGRTLRMTSLAQRDQRDAAPAVARGPPARGPRSGAPLPVSGGRQGHQCPADRRRLRPRSSPPRRATWRTCGSTSSTR